MQCFGIAVSAEENRLQGGTTHCRALLGFNKQRLPKHIVKTKPAAGCIAVPTQQSRCLVGSHQRGFDQQRATAAHRIEQRAAFAMNFLPAAAGQHRCCEIFLQRRFALRTAPTTAMQRAAADIYGEHRTSFSHDQIDAQIWRFGFDRGSHAMCCANLINDGILDPLRGVTLMRQLRAGNMRIHSQCAFGRDVFRPIDGLHALVKIVFVLAIEFRQWPHHPACQARKQRRAIKHFRLALDIDASHGRCRVDCAQGEQLINQQIFQALGASDEKLHANLCSKRPNSSAQNAT